MALISTIRKHSGLAVGIMAIGLILFLIGGDIIQLSSILSGRHRRDVGEIAGQKITFQDYQTQVERLRQLIPPDAGVQESFIRDQAWQRLISQLSYQRECDALGLTISEVELVDMVQGEHIHPELQAAFQNSDTKQFDKQQLINYLQKVAQMPEAQRTQWYQFESELAALRQREKFTQMMVKSAFVTDLEAQARHDAARTKRHIKCLYIPYYTRSDDSVQVTDKMLKDYLTAHKSTYQIEERRGIQYVVFPITPTKEDEQAFQKDLHALKQAFAQAKDGFSFAKINTDGKPSRSYLNLTSQQLPDALATQQSQLKKGMVVGPVQEGNVYKLYKVGAIDPRAAKPYNVAVIEKQLVAGDQARDQLFRKADYCASAVKNEPQLQAYGTQEILQLHEAQVGKNDVQVGELPQARALVRWLYNDAAVGQVSPVLELDDAYVVAIMTKHIPSGTTPLAQVRDEIALKVRNQQKACAIMANLQQHEGTTLEEKKGQYGSGARLLEAKELLFEDDTLQSAGMARKTVGTSFGLPPGTQETVADDNGVLVVEVVTQHNATTLEDVAAYQQSLKQLNQLEQPYNIFQAWEALTPVKDDRYKFY